MFGLSFPHIRLGYVLLESDRAATEVSTHVWIQHIGACFGGIERRVRGGMVFGVGLAFIAVTALRPWSTSIPTAIFYFLAGALAARLLGLLVDGTVSKQWLLVAVEAVVMALAALWLWRSSGSAP